jgi:hypothetical protein
MLEWSGELGKCWEFFLAILLPMKDECFFKQPNLIYNHNFPHKGAPIFTERQLIGKQSMG